MSFVFIIPHGIKTSPSIEGIGFTKDRGKSSFGPGQRKGFTIHFNIKGIGYLNGNIVKEGQGFLVYDGMYAHHYADKDNPWELLWITLSDACAIELFQQYKADPDTHIFDYHSPMLLREIANKIQSYKEISLDSLELLEYFLQIHCNCLKIKSAPYSKHSSEIYLEYALKYIKDSIHRAVSVEEITRLIGISQPYLYKLFVKEFNMSPKQYIINLRIDTAKKMLITTNMTITEIANSVGYADILTFSRFFSLKVKMSPTEYRNNH